MKNFKSLFPFKTEEEIPTNIKEKIDEVKFDNLPAGFYSASGFATIANNDRVIESDGRHLFKYVEQSRQVNAHAVEALYQERLQKASEDTIRDGQLCKELYDQAERESLKYSPIKSSVVFIIVDAATGLVLCGGSTVKKCEDALKKLRSALGTFPVLPLWFGERTTRVLATYIAKPESRPHSGHALPEYLVLSPVGKTVATGADSSQKASFDGIRLTDEGMQSVLAGMDVRSVEMNLIDRPADGQADIKANFVLCSSIQGDLHLKGFDYSGSLSPSEGDDLAHEYATEMLIVSKYTARIVNGLSVFFGVEEEENEE